MNKLKRSRAGWEQLARIDDMYFHLLSQWEQDCRLRSTTGENMVRENMDEQDYETFLIGLRMKAMNLIAKKDVENEA